MPIINVSAPNVRVIGKISAVRGTSNISAITSLNGINGVLSSAGLHGVIYLLVITLLINFGGWTFNKEAVADVWLDEQHCIVGAAAEHSAASQPVPAKSKSPAIICNQWCHIVGHFIAIVTPTVAATPEFATAYSRNPASVYPLYFPDGRFRPPRLHS